MLILFIYKIFEPYTAFAIMYTIVVLTGYVGVYLLGKEISEKERIAFGDLLFKKMKLADLNNLSNTLVQDFGKTECACMKCKRRWKAPLDLTNFFDLEAE